MKIQEFTVLCLCLGVKVATGKIIISNHGYEGIVVSIGNHVREDPLLIKRLQQYLTVTSQALFKATRNQIYFRDIVVVIPQNWTTESHYKSAKDADVEHAQIIIDHPNPAYGEAPYVKQYAECGQPGLYIHLTPNYLLDDEVTFRWGLPEKTLVHEWAHLRWGLFDEYPIDPQDTPFYRHAGRWEPVRCSSEVEGVLRSEYHKGECPFDLYTGRPGHGCKFYPRMKYNKAVSSILFMQYLESITDFCDDPQSSHSLYRHNVFAPNRQNRLCNYRSAWEVMRKHEDFKTIGAPLPAFTDTSPRFHFVQVKPTRRVLVLDASGSMTGSSLHTLRQAASNYILTSVESGSWLGIVQFNTVASRLSPLTEIKSDRDRLNLINSLPFFAEGKTSIGAGLGAGLKTLEDSKSGKGGTLILITDGKENKSPWIKDIKPSLMKNSIMVHALAYTQQAEASIAQLAGETEGRTFFYTGERNSTSLIDGFAATLSGKTFNDFAVSITTEAVQVFKNKPYTETFIIDETIGHETTITFVYTGDIDVGVEGPNTQLTNKDKSYHKNNTHGILTVSVPGIAEPGQWTYTVTSKSPYANAVVHVQSQKRSNNKDVIRVKSWISAAAIGYHPKTKLSIFAEVSRGYAPVLGAKVKAVMERPSTVPIELELLDDGIGSDLIKEDGVYSSYVLPNDLRGDGRYSMKVKALGDNLSTKVIVVGHRSGAIESGKSGNVMPNSETAPLSGFQRVTSAGEFRVEGYWAAKKSESDVIPPARIGDLTVSSYDQDTGLVILKWTAVGDDMGRGKASGYKLLMSKNITDLLYNTENEEKTTLYNGTMPQPNPVGLDEEMNFTLLHLRGNETVFLSLQAFDEVDNHGNLSNIVSVSFVTDISIPRERITPVSSLNYLTVVLAPVLSVLVFITVMTILCLIWARRRHPKGDKGLCHGESTSQLGSIISEFPHMNYRVDGEYVKRSPEEHAPWNIQ